MANTRALNHSVYVQIPLHRGLFCFNADSWADSQNGPKDAVVLVRRQSHRPCREESASFVPRDRKWIHQRRATRMPGDRPGAGHRQAKTEEEPQNEFRMRELLEAILNRLPR